VKPAAFRYAAPESVEETVALLHAHGTEGKLLAGGQSLVPLLNMRLARPSVIIDLNRVKTLDYIREENGEIAIGAMTRQRTAERSPVVTRRLPLLADALPLVGHLQIRTRGTVGGNIAHADPSAELPAVLAALEGSVVVRGPGGTRRVAAHEFFVSYLTTPWDRTSCCSKCGSRRTNNKALRSWKWHAGTATTPWSAWGRW